MNVQNRWTRILALSLIAGWLLMPTVAQASVPQLMTYHGTLKDSSGNYLTGSYNMTFRIYTASTGGTAVWTESQTGVSATSGRFNVELGSVTTLNLDFSQDYWLSIEVASDGEMTPRVKLTSVGYAYMAEKVVDGFTQTQHDALSHMGTVGVKSAHTNIAKTNFKLDAYSLASANTMGDMIVDVFNDATGIDDAISSNYEWKGSADYDVRVPMGSGGIDANTVLMLHGNGSDASTTFTDSSDTPHTATANGNAQIDTAQSKFGGAAALFDGTGDYVSVSDHADWHFGSGDFAIDMWIRFNSVADAGMVGQEQDINNHWDFHYKNGSLIFEIGSGGVTVTNITTAWSPIAGAWYHVGVTRSGNDYRFFIDGTQLGTTQTDTDAVDNFSGNLVVGKSSRSGHILNGWLDEVRISKGTARWTANFTPETTEYAAPSPSGTATVISTAFSESFVPAEAMIIADETLNTGSTTYYISRDNGTTWTAATNEAVTDISAQPSGTQMRWKAVINDDAELEAIAIAL